MHRSSEGSVLTAGGSGWVNRRLITVAEPQLTSDCDRMTNILSEILGPVKTPGQNTLVLQLICSTWVLMDGLRVHCWWFWSKVSLKLEPTLSRQMNLPWKFSPKFVSFFMIKKKKDWCQRWLFIHYFFLTISELFLIVGWSCNLNTKATYISKIYTMSSTATRGHLLYLWQLNACTAPQEYVSME